MCKKYVWFFYVVYPACQKIEDFISIMNMRLLIFSVQTYEMWIFIFIFICLRCLYVKMLELSQRILLWVFHWWQTKRWTNENPIWGDSSGEWVSFNIQKDRVLWFFVFKSLSIKSNYRFAVDFLYEHSLNIIHYQATFQAMAAHYEDFHKGCICFILHFT